MSGRFHFHTLDIISCNSQYYKEVHFPQNFVYLVNPIFLLIPREPYRHSVSPSTTSKWEPSAIFLRPDRFPLPFRTPAEILLSLRTLHFPFIGWLLFFLPVSLSKRSAHSHPCLPTTLPHAFPLYLLRTFQVRYTKGFKRGAYPAAAIRSIW